MYVVVIYCFGKMGDVSFIYVGVFGECLDVVGGGFCNVV